MAACLECPGPSRAVCLCTCQQAAVPWPPQQHVPGAACTSRALKPPPASGDLALQVVTRPTQACVCGQADRAVWAQMLPSRERGPGTGHREAGTRASWDEGPGQAASSVSPTQQPPSLPFWLQPTEPRITSTAQAVSAGRRPSPQTHPAFVLLRVPGRGGPGPLCSCWGVMWRAGGEVWPEGEGRSDRSATSAGRRPRLPLDAGGSFPRLCRAPSCLHSELSARVASSGSLP